MLLIKLVNDTTGSKEIGNYKYEILITEVVEGEEKPHLIKISEGKLKGHKRSKGFEPLVKMLSEDLERKKLGQLAQFLIDTRS
jgi:hypothetical protein